MSDKLRILTRQVEVLRDCTPLVEGLHYRMMFDFLLQHGQGFPHEPYRRKYPVGAAKFCFGNAIVYAVIKGWSYVEGIAMGPHGVAIHHAWNVDKSGQVIDTTWRNQGVAYLGVPFSLARADDCTWHGDASILDDYQRGWPLFQQRWQGEVEPVGWEPSTALSYLLDELKKTGSIAHLLTPV